MNTKMKFLWIDDNSTRENYKKILEYTSFPKMPRAKVDFQKVQNQDLNYVIKKIIKKYKKKTPDLIILDHILDKIKPDTNFVGQSQTTGTTLSFIFHEIWPDCPIVGITAARNEPKISVKEKTAYEDFYEDNSFDNHFEQLFVLAKTFKYKKNFLHNSDNEKIINLLKPPQSIKEELIRIIPEDRSRSCLSSLYKWLRKSLFANPGFLYDKLWIATFIGLTESGFEKVDHLFDVAKYKGVFATSSAPRWWPIMVKQIISQKVRSNNISFSWELGHLLPRVKPCDYSKCYVCEKKYPEIIGYTDDTFKKQYPMHIGCTKPCTNTKKSLYFEEKRRQFDF